jgi:hypothetical protein
MMTLAGVLPVSALNIGLAGQPAMFVQAAGDLGIDMAKAVASLALQGSMKAALPSFNPAVLLAGRGLLVSNLASMLNPATWVTLSGSAKASLLADIGLVEASLLAAGEVGLTLSAGLGASGLAGWAWGGPAAGFGEALAGVRTWGRVPPSATVQGIVVATESQASWSAFGSGFNIGGSAAGGGRLEFLGELSAGELNTGVLAFSEWLDLYLLKLRGLKAKLDYQLDVSLGLHPPDPQVMIDVALNADLGLGLDNLLNVSVDFQAKINGIQARIDYLLQLAADLALELSAGGLAVWVYSGPASEFGAALQAATERGIPGGHGPSATAYGVAVACAIPGVWSTFGSIFAVGGGN